METILLMMNDKSKNLIDKLEVNVKLSVCITKYHAIKTYPLLNQSSRHQDVLGTEGITPCILNFVTRWRWMLSFTLYFWMYPPTSISVLR